MNKRFIIQSFVIIIWTMIACGTVYARELHAPITPEMLTTLRASRTINAAHAPGRGIVTFDGLRATSLEFPDDNADVMSSRWALEQAFSVLISHECYPIWLPHATSFLTNYRFAYTVHANERLVDALERLMEATDSNVRWRLRNGHIILTAMPRECREGVPIIGDRVVQVDISERNLYAALLQLETQYNAQYSDYALTILPTCLRSVAHMTAPPDVRKSGMIVLRTKDALRDIILNLLAQTGEPRMKYMIALKRIISPDGLPAPFYEHEDIFYYSLSYNAPLLEETLKLSWGMREPPLDEGVYWIREVFDAQRQRLRQYLLRNHPDIAALDNQKPDLDNANNVE